MTFFSGEFSHFYFKWPWVFLLFLLLPLVPWLWRTLQKRRWQRALRFSYTAVAAYATQEASTSPWKRLLPSLLMLYVVCFLVFALARPVTVMRVPTQLVDMMIVMDISISMLAQDIPPSRSEAAKKAGMAFIRRLPPDVRVGLVFFASNSYAVSPPTRDHHRVERLLSSLSEKDLQSGTAIGSAIQTALRTLVELDEQDKAQQAEAQAETSSETSSPQPQRVIVLVSDGDQQLGYPWEQAALNARDQNVFIYTVGIGSREGADIEYEGQSYHVIMNDHTLQQIAAMTDGQYFRAFEKSDFQTIYDQVRERTVRYEDREEELAAIFSAIALVLLLVQQSLLVFWVKRFP